MSNTTMHDQSLQDLIASEMLADQIKTMKNKIAKLAPRMIDKEFLALGSCKELHRRYMWKSLKRELATNHLRQIRSPLPCHACHEPAFYKDKVYSLPACDITLRYINTNVAFGSVWPLTHCIN
jgi:hypothetical protein